MLLSAVVIGTLMAIGVTAAEVKLTVLWRTTTSELQTMQEAFSAYEAGHPGIKIDLLADSGAAGEDKLKTMFAAGNPPDIFASVFLAGFIDYVYNDMVLDLTPYIERDKFNLKDFLPGSVNTFTVNGRIYGLPRGGVGTVGFYNADLFDQAGIQYPPTKWQNAGWTWDYVAQIGKKLSYKQADGTYSQVAMQQAFSPLFNHVSLMWGTKIFGDDMYKYGIGTTTRINDPVVIESFQRLLDLRFVDGVNPLPAVNKAGSFAGGKVGMYYGIGSLATYRNSMFKWSIMPLPRGRSDVQQMDCTYTGPLFVSRSSKHPQEAWELLSYLVSQEGQRYIAPGATIGTSRISMLRWLADYHSIPWDIYSDVMFGAYENGWESANVRLVNYSGISALFTQAENDMWQGKLSAQAALARVAPGLEALLKETSLAYQQRRNELFGMK